MLIVESKHSEIIGWLWDINSFDIITNQLGCLINFWFQWLHHARLYSILTSSQLQWPVGRHAKRLRLPFNDICRGYSLTKLSRFWWAALVMTKFFFFLGFVEELLLGNWFWWNLVSKGTAFTCHVRTWRYACSSEWMLPKTQKRAIVGIKLHNYFSQYWQVIYAESSLVKTRLFLLSWSCYQGYR